MAEKITKTSQNLQNDNLEKLRKVFPNFVKDGQVDFDALKKFFTDEEILAGEEKYGLNWAGKSNAFKLIRTPATGTLTPQEKESKNFNETQNLFIEGDNLEVLKLLQKKYREQIKMIYIDPPYNTGKDFIYKDNFKENISDYYERSGQSENGIKLTTNLESNGRYHSDWLTMMYPRLFLARNLLKDDGVIFVSIDDNEVANLRLIMDEIFGEENFVGQLIWKNKKGGGNDARFIAIEHEYILMYAKSTDILEKLFHAYSEEYIQRYKNEDEKGKFFWDTFHRKTGKQYYPVICPDGTVLEKDDHGNPISWLRSEKRFKSDLEEGEIRIMKVSDAWSVQFKQRMPEGKKPRSLIYDFGTTSDGSNEIFELFKTHIFSNPKPTLLLRHLIDISTSEKDIILDFFAGSGTTAHAVMDLNAEDGGNRKWICVQIPEETAEDSEVRKAGYENIAQISRERIRRAGSAVAKAMADKEGDIGFKAFSLEKSNYRQWNELTEQDDAEKLKAQMKLFLEKPLVDGFEEKSVVYEILVKEGFDLNAGVQQEKNDDLQIWSVKDADKKMTASFAEKISKEQVEKLGLGENDIFVCLDSALDDTIKVNIMRNLIVKVI